MRKSKEQAETLSWFAHTKVYSQLHFLCSRRGEKKGMKTELTVLAGQRETTSHEIGKTEREREREESARGRERADTDVELSCTFSLVVVIGTSLWGLPWPQCIRAPTAFHIVVSRSQLAFLPRHVSKPSDSFLFPIPHPLTSSIFIWVPFCQSEHVVDLLQIRFYF